MTISLHDTKPGKITQMRIVRKYFGNRVDLQIKRQILKYPGTPELDPTKSGYEIMPYETPWCFINSKDFAEIVEVQNFLDTKAIPVSK